MTYLPPGNQDPYGQQQPQPPQDPFSAQQPNPYEQPNPYAQPTAPLPSSVPPTSPYGQPYGGYPVVAAPPQNTMALTSMILSIAGILVLVTAPIGAILGHIALKQIRQTGESGEGMAKAGIIVGWIVTGLIALGGLCCLGSIIWSSYQLSNVQ